MATNLSIDPDLLDRALAVSGERTKKAAVTKALQEFIARRHQKRLLELMGKLEWDKGSTTRPSARVVEPLCRHQRVVAGFPARRRRFDERVAGTDPRDRSRRGTRNYRIGSAGAATRLLGTEKPNANPRSLRRIAAVGSRPA